MYEELTFEALSFWREINFSSLRRSASSAPYLPEINILRRDGRHFYYFHIYLYIYLAFYSISVFVPNKRGNR